MKRVLILVMLLLLVACSNTTGYEIRPIKSIDQTEFKPIILSANVLPSAGPPITPEPTIKPKPKPRATVAPKKTTRQVIRYSATLVGKASWYCSNSQPICHHAYPPGSMVAAACGKLRRVMGTWRGRVVTVRANGRSVRVKLVDWCGSTTKTIDLYYAPMRKLGGTGVLTVKISW